jgi:hypothetical protein
MESFYFTGQPVEITAVYFRPGNQPTELESYPRRMVTEDGLEYTFLESGVRYLVKKGQEFVKLFEVTDGQREYRLRLDEQQHWTLIGTKFAA